MLFPSEEWCTEAIRLANADPEAASAGKGWKGDLGAVIEAEAGKLPKAFALYCEPRDGQITRFRVLKDPDELDEIEPAYLARAPYSVWKGLLLGTLDPVEAVLRKRISVQGDVQQLIERMKFRGIFDRVLTTLKTRFIDDSR